ncbi:MAG TPA: hypothetical protein VN203_22365 [Candidatus Acidoferrum sp.]|nr:hypothetical protein [Candidatus Acidoferrum sp.]
MLHNHDLDQAEGHDPYYEDPEEHHYVIKGPEEVDRLLHFVLQEKEYGGHREAGDFLVAYQVDFACWLSYPESGSPVWNDPGEKNARIAIIVYDRDSLRLIHNLQVWVTVLDEHGYVVGTNHHPFLFRPGHNQYGADWELPGDGKYTLRVRIEAPDSLRRLDGERYTSPVSAEFHNVEISCGHKVS